ncbi:VOC family protein [Caulobacter sp. KR2-114]|uniref:VOC family protein n=1 Tax=Caulobacter sp. KR2-114 TaxID=3400912 RepID=UPI003C0FCCB4
MIIDLNHVNILTDQVEETAAFFERVLGLKAGYRPDFDFHGAWLYAGERPLIHLQTPGSSKNRATDAPVGQGALDHASFEVADIAVARERLKANAVTFRETRSPDGRNDQIFFRDPNGVVIELIAKVA